MIKVEKRVLNNYYIVYDVFAGTEAEELQVIKIIENHDLQPIINTLEQKVTFYIHKNYSNDREKARACLLDLFYETL